MKLAIVIPAYNEGSVISKVIQTIPKRIMDYEVVSIVIDDGSSDDTYQNAKKYADYTIRHIVNLGQGAAFATGFQLAKKLECNITVTIDADGQHSPDDIIKLVEPIVNKEADIVSGSRMFDKSSMPAIKVFGNWLMNFITFLVFHKWVSDSQTGMRSFSQNALRMIKIYSLGHEVCSEIVGEAKRNNLRFLEVPITTIYTDYSKAKGQNIFNAINIFTRILTIKLFAAKEQTNV